METSSEAVVSWRSPKLRALLASTLVLPLGVTLLSPVLPVIRSAFGLTDFRTSLLIACYFLPGIVFSPVVGLLADRYGRRSVLLPSLIGFGLVGGSIAFVDNFTLILAMRVIQGSAAAGIFILTVTFISDLFHGIERNTVLGINSACLFLGAALFPFVGGFLGAIAWNVPFFAYFIAIPVAIYVYSRLDEPPVIGCRTGPGYLHGAAHALPRQEVVALYGTAFVLEAIAFGALLTALPFILVREIGASSVVTGVVLTSMMLVAATVAIVNGHLITHQSNHRLIVFSFWCFGVGLLVVWTGSTIPVIFAGASIVGIGFGLAHPCVDAAISRLAPPEYRAGALSLRNTMTFTGRATGPVVFTGVAAVTGYGPLLVAAGVGTVCLGAVGMVITEPGPRVPEATTQ